MNRRYKRWFLWLDVLGGVLSINLAFAAAAALRFEDLSVQNPTYYNYYVQLVVFFNLLWLLLRLLRGEGEWQQKDPGVRRKVSRNLSLVIAHLFAFGILALALKDQATYFSRLFGLYFYSALLTLLTVWSFVLHGFEMRLATNMGLRKCLATKMRPSKTPPDQNAACANTSRPKWNLQGPKCKLLGKLVHVIMNYAEHASPPRCEQSGIP